MSTGATPSGAPCPMRNLVPAYVNGTLGRVGDAGWTPDDLADHLRSCTACRAEYAAWVAIAGAVRATVAAPATRAATRRFDGVLAALDAVHPGEERDMGARSLDVAEPLADSSPLLPSRERQLLPWLGAGGLVAALLLLLVALDRRPSPDNERHRLPALAASSPESTPAPNAHVRIVDDAIDIAECTTEPRAPGTVAGLLAATGGTPLPGLFGGIDRLYGYAEFGPELNGPTPAPDVLAGIEKTLRQVIACRYNGMAVFGEQRYDLDSRHLALFSDRYVTDLALQMEGTGFRLPLLPATSAPLSVIDAAQTGDGNVLVRLAEMSGYGPGAVTVLFAPERGFWVVDEWGEHSFPGDVPPYLAEAVPQTYQVIVTGTMAARWSDHDGASNVLPAAVVTVANIGEATCQFAIPGLGFAIDIGAGHSVDLRVDAPPGTYALDVSVSGSTDRLDAELIVEPEHGGAAATPRS